MTPQEIVSLLQEMGTLLEPGAKVAWDIAMRQVYTTMALNLVLGIAAILVCIRGLRFWVQ